jgi:putative FmdB family regulatory protein
MSRRDSTRLHEKSQIESEIAMPVYDYRCADCGAFEATRRIAERDDALACPGCGAPAERITVCAPALGGAASGDGDEGQGSYGMRHTGGCLCCR